MAKLVLSQNGVIVKEYPITEGSLFIGRKASNTVQIDDITVSGQHAELVTEKNKFMDSVNDTILGDLNSTNGTYVNGKRIKKQMLRHGDLIRIGRHEFKFLDEDAPDFDKTVLMQADSAKPQNGLIEAFVRVENGPKAGTQLDLVKSYTTIGNSGLIVVISKQSIGYFISQVTSKAADSGLFPTVNNNPIGAQKLPLQDQDIIEIGGLNLTFVVKSEPDTEEAQST